MNTLDKDIGWLSSRLMVLCTCGHREKSHRPMSRRCAICDCQKFTPHDIRKNKDRAS